MKNLSITTLSSEIKVDSVFSLKLFVISPDGKYILFESPYICVIVNGQIPSGLLPIISLFPLLKIQQIIKTK